MHIEIDDDLVRQIDDIAGPRGRSSFVRTATENAVRQQRRWELLKSAAGSISDTGHDWDDDPARWVHEQRRADPRRAG
jgi:Arc/MetJ family transcription regulator